jgi:V8-like Glu-specific endopeptidase
MDQPRISCLGLLVLGSACGVLSTGCSAGDGPRDEEQSSSVSQPIIGGTTDSGDPSAVLLGGGGGWCSGTLIAPRVVLTAGHCISPSNNFVYFGPQYLGDAGGAVVSVAQSYTNPAYVSSNFRDADIGVVILATPSNVPPTAINTVALDASDVGQDLHIVGFGGTASPTEPEFTKMQVTTAITGVTAKEIAAGPSICGGDSGGPAMLTVNGAPVVAGVTSWHSTQACGGDAGFARVDLYAQWIQQQIDAAEAVDGGADDGAAEAGGDGASQESGDGAAHGGDGAAQASGDGGATGTGPDGAAGAGGEGGAMNSGSSGGALSPATSEHGGCTFAARSRTPGHTGAAATLLAIGCGVWRRRRKPRR